MLAPFIRLQLNLTEKVTLDRGLKALISKLDGEETRIDPPLSAHAQSELPAGLEEIVMKAIEAEPGKRFTHAAEMNDALGAVIAREGGTCSMLSPLISKGNHPDMDGADPTIVDDTVVRPT